MRAAGGALLVGALLTCSMVVLAAPEIPPADLPAQQDRRCGLECRSCEADGCLHCSVLLVPGSSGAGTCTSACPRGSSEALAHGERHMGRVCYPDKLYSEVLVGGCAGAVLCALVALCAVLHARLRRRRPARHAAPGLAAEEAVRLHNFHNQMDCLRPHAYALLTILNNTRRQVRELYQFGNHEAALAYSCVLSDLAKLLLLLNKAQVPVVPEEWPRLFSWANKILRRYYYLSSTGHQQVSRLASFLQPSPPCPPSPPSLTLQTFKSALSASSMDLNDDSLDKEHCPWDDNVRPPSYSRVPLAINATAVPLANTNAWDNREYLRRTSIWLEDELFQSARRPQDELTTEL